MFDLGRISRNYLVDEYFIMLGVTVREMYLAAMRLSGSNEIELSSNHYFKSSSRYICLGWLSFLLLFWVNRQEIAPNYGCCYCEHAFLV